MKELTERKTIRFSKKQIEEINELKKYKINVGVFIRNAIFAKLNKEMPLIIKKFKENNKNKCPF